MIQTSPTITETPRFDTRTVEVVTAGEVSAAPSKLTWWGAITAGAFIAVAAQIVFTVLGMAIGLSVIGIADNPPESALSIGAGVWWLVTGFASLFLGGLTAGRLCSSADSFIGGMHGLLSWCAVTVLSAVLLAITGSAALGGSLAIVGDRITASDNQPLNVNTSSSFPPGQASDSQNAGNRDATGGSSDSGANTDASNTPLKNLPQDKDAAQHAAVGAWWTLAAMVFGAALAYFGGSAGVRSVTSNRPVPVASATRTSENV